MVKRKYVVPGDLIVEGDLRASTNTFKTGNRIYSLRVGLAEIGNGSVRVIPLSGTYIPRVGDVVVGEVIDISAFAWQLDINSCFYGYLTAQSVFGRGYSPSKYNLSNKFKIGDLLLAKIQSFDRTRDPMLSISGPGLGPIERGVVIKVNAMKVPRLIGKKGSMIRLIESATKCKVILGQNGVIVVSGEPDGVSKAIEIIRLVESKAHLAELNRMVKELIDSWGVRDADR
ncbi:MAG: RNA-binding protein [Thaumarchaeota archaeon]|nr:RNA-binding protein [Nitrososphaerota archaeon]